MKNEEQLSEKYKLLSTIKCPEDVKRIPKEQLGELAEELRNTIIETVSQGGGHLAPSLGVIELTLALFSVFDLEEDKLIWDVGHQAYAHKILTGRMDRFHTLRKFGGISGFPRRAESKYDHFGVGHSSTSISGGLGMAMGRDLLGKDNNVVSIIGDGSMTAGLAYEGLNQAGGMGKKMIVVLNDNEMSISKNVGALSSFLSRTLSGPFLTRMKKETENLLKQIPRIGDDLAMYARRGEDSFKTFFTEGMLFEAFRFTYMGPFDGHNLEGLVDVFNRAKQLDSPVLVHVNTIKGKGYVPAQTNPTYFHGVGCFEPETGKARKFAGKKALKSHTEVFGDTLCAAAEKDDKVVAITAAMPEGTGTSCFSEKFPDRFVDVGICEQHAVTFAAGLAVEGFKPCVAIYSTFLQRAYDQVVHDVCLQNLNVNFFLDRGGLVGEDGGTHHGAFDLSFLRHIPNLVLMAPKDEAELQRMIFTAIDHPGPAAVRYPRGVGVGAPLSEDPELIPLGEGEVVHEGSDALMIVLGSRVHPAIEGAEELHKEHGLSVAVFNTRFVKPLPEKQLRELAGRFDKILLAEENALQGGFGSAVLEFFCDNNLLEGKTIKRLGLPDEFVEHGAQRELRKMLGIDKQGMKKAVLELVGKTA